SEPPGPPGTAGALPGPVGTGGVCCPGWVDCPGWPYGCWLVEVLPYEPGAAEADWVDADWVDADWVDAEEGPAPDTSARLAPTDRPGVAGTPDGGGNISLGWRRGPPCSVPG